LFAKRRNEINVLEKIRNYFREISKKAATDFRKDLEDHHCFAEYAEWVLNA
jgi:hypothetical protein